MIESQQIKKEAKNLFEQLISWRRQIHRHPETGLYLPVTAALVTKVLSDLGLEPKMVGTDNTTGVTALIDSGRSGPAILLRADMDALPLREENNLSFKSEIEGKAHMCGHDTHTAMLLGAATILVQHKDDFNGSIQLMFQPGEEGYNGASHMIEDGLLENPKPSAAIAMHCLTGSKWKTGTLLCATGLLAKASADTFRITLQGAGAHGATPEHGKDVVYALSRLIDGLYAIRSRELSAFTPAMLSVCQIHAGHADNILPDDGFVTGTFRTFDPEVREFIRRRIHEIAEATASAFRTIAKVEFSGGLAPTLNDKDLCPESWGYLKELSPENTDIIGPVTGAEDFSEIACRIPSAYVDLSFGSVEDGYSYAVHSPRCLFDENALPEGAACYAWLALRWLKDHAPA